MAKRYVVIHEGEMEILAAQNSASLLNYLNANDPAPAGSVEMTDEDEASLSAAFAETDAPFISIDWEKYCEALGYTKIAAMESHAEHLADKGL